MKALIRNKYEILPERGQTYIDWVTGAPLTNPSWAGGPYTLVQNYVPPMNDEPAQYEEVVEDPEPTPQEEDVVEDDDYVVINGVRYSKEELRRLIE